MSEHLNNDPFESEDRLVPHQTIAALDQPHLEFHALDVGIAAHNRISRAICFLPSSGDPTESTHQPAPELDDQIIDGLERAGLFNRIGYPFPFPVSYFKSARHVSQMCRLGDRMVELQCPEPMILDAIKMMLGPMLDDAPKRRETDDVIALQYHGDGFGVFVNQRPIFGQSEFAVARHLVMREIAISLAGRHRVSAAFHAGSAGTRNKAIVFAADSGSGKSTLTAALSANGYVYHCDDQVVLVGQEGRISSYPTRIGLKQGSWSVAELAPYDVEAIEPTFVGDGYVKLLQPPRIGDPAIQPKIAAFVFPAFSAEGQFEMTRLSGMEAMQRLISSGSRLIGRYPTIRPLAQTLARVPAYALSYSNTVQAMDAVSDILEKDNH